MSFKKYFFIFSIIFLLLNCQSPSEPTEPKLAIPTIKILVPQNDSILSSLNSILFVVSTETYFYGTVEVWFDSEKKTTLSTGFDTSYYENHYDWTSKTVFIQLGEHSIELRLFSDSGNLLDKDKIIGKSIPLLYPPIYTNGTFLFDWMKYENNNFDRYILLESESSDMLNSTHIFSNTNSSDTNFLVSGIAPNMRKHYQLIIKTTEDDSIFSPVVIGSSYKKIVSTSNSEESHDQNIDLFLIDADGQNKIQLTNNWREDYDPHFSPDGLKIVYTSDEEVHIMDINGNHKYQLSNSGLYPQFTPDGSQIIFQHQSDIYRINIDGRNLTQITNTQYSENSPKISPNGQNIIFTFSFQNQWDIGFVGIDGSNYKNLTNSADECYVPEISPDGLKIVYHLRNQNRSDLILMNIDGSDMKNLTENFNHGIKDPKFSSDGTTIIFHSTDGIYTIDPDGTNITHRVDDINIISAQFTPDGSKILYNTGYNIILMNKDGSDIIQITNNINAQQEQFQPSF